MVTNDSVPRTPLPSDDVSMGDLTMRDLTPDGIPTPYFDEKDRTPFPSRERRRLSWGEATATITLNNTLNTTLGDSACDDTTIFLRSGGSVKGTILDGIDLEDDEEEEDQATITLRLPPRVTISSTMQQHPPPTSLVPPPHPQLNSNGNNLPSTSTTSTTGAPAADVTKANPFIRSAAILERMRLEELELEKEIRELQGL